MKTETKKTELEHQDKEPIHLFVDERAQQDSVIPLRWCICKEVFDQLKEQMAENPCLLLVVTSSRDEEVCRKLVPLDQMMDYVSFGGPGQHRILATIVWEDGKGVRDLKNGFVVKRHGTYRYNDILDWKGNFREDLGRFGREGGGRWLEKTAELKVDVAGEFFAKEPPKWLRGWTNLWYETSPVDQCQLRRRCILAFSVQPPLVLLWTIFVCSLRFLLVALFLLCGLRRINFDPLFHPLGCRTKQLTWNMKKGRLSVFFSTKDGDRRPCFFWPLTPIFILSLAGGLYLLLGVWAGVSVWLVLAILGLVVLGLFFGALIVCILYCLGCYLRGKIKTPGYDYRAELERIKKREQKEREEKEKALLMLEKNLLPLVCTGVVLKPDLNDLPWGKRTVYLRFLDLKRMVCKPFARY